MRAKHRCNRTLVSFQDPKSLEDFSTRPVLDGVIQAVKSLIAKPWRQHCVIKKDFEAAEGVSAISPQKIQSIKSAEPAKTTNPAKTTKKLPLSGETTKSEPILFYLAGTKLIAAIVTEAKRTKHSLSLCLPQVCALANDVMIRLRNLGFPLGDCAVMGVISAGRYIQIIGASLLPPAFPNFYLLSDPLDRSREDHLVRLSCWIQEMAKFTQNTIDVWKRVARIRPTAIENVTLLLQELWIKPVAPPLSLRFQNTETGESHHKLPPHTEIGEESQEHLLSAHGGCVTRIMRVYKMLHDTVAKRYVFFPLGLAQLPAENINQYDYFQKKNNRRGFHVRKYKTAHTFADIPITQQLVA